MVEEQNVQMEEKVFYKSKMNYVYIALAVGMVIFFIFLGTAGSKESQILRVTEDGVREGLKYNADEAEFSPSDETQFDFYGDNQEYVTVSGWVNAFNGFGVKSKVPYDAELELNSSGKWEFYDFTLYEDYDDLLEDW